MLSGLFFIRLIGFSFHNFFNLLFSVKMISIILSITSKMTLTRRLMNINKSPRRIDRKAGGRNKKVVIKNYSKENYEKKKNIY